MKQAAWQTLQIEFNVRSLETFHDTNTLKNKYLNIMKKLGDEKVHMKGTAGGGSQATSLSQKDHLLLGILREKRLGMKSSDYNDDHPRSMLLYWQVKGKCRYHEKRISDHLEYYNTQEWESTFTLGLNTTKNIDYI